MPKNNASLEKMNEDEDDVYMTSIHDRYAARPNTLEDVCLAKFAVNYEPVFGASKEEDVEINIYDDNDEITDNNDCITATSKCQPVIKLKDGLANMQETKKRGNSTCDIFSSRHRARKLLPCLTFVISSLAFRKRALGWLSNISKSLQ